MASDNPDQDLSIDDSSSPSYPLDKIRGGQSERQRKQAD